MRPFQEFRVWQASHELTLVVYDLTRAFPREELFGLTGQMRRAAASIPTNIAEGSARGDKEFHQFLRIALGSAAELEYQLMLARDLTYLGVQRHQEINDMLSSVKRMLVTFLQTVERPGARASGQRPTANGQRRAAPQ